MDHSRPQYCRFLSEVVGVTKNSPILNVVSIHSTDAGRNFVVQNRTKSLSCPSLATIQDGSGVTWASLIKGFNWLASSLDILINSDVSSLTFFGFAFRLTSLTCCLFLGKTLCDWNPSKPPASSKNFVVYLRKAPFVLLLPL